MPHDVQRLTAFSTSPTGGNPAGVWIGDTLPSAEVMQKIAREIGYSETAFVSPTNGFKRTIRYYSPEAEVAFCGHATVAAAVALGKSHGEGQYILESSVGEVPVTVSDQQGLYSATLTAVSSRQKSISHRELQPFLDAIDWNQSELDSALPPVYAFAGNWHLVIAASSKSRLDTLEYDFEQLKRLMLEHGLTTLQLVWQESPDRFHSRNPFPVGGVHEDPATGAAAAALGGYLRDAELIAAPFSFEVRQGYAMGRPSILQVFAPKSGGIQVSGTAIDIADAEDGACS